MHVSIQFSMWHNTLNFQNDVIFSWYVCKDHDVQKKNDNI